jgi:outer membrane receptor protein involved in Fe transport
VRILRVAAAIFTISLLVASVGPGRPQAATTASPAPEAAPSTSSATLNGTVADSRGNPLSKATVRVTGQGISRSVETGPDGTFSFVLPPGLYTVYVAHGGFQDAVLDSIGLARGIVTSEPITLNESTSGTLRTIGRVSVNRRNSINGGATSVAVLGGDVIAYRELPNLTTTVGELPGVTVSTTTGATANTFFAVRGFQTEAKVNIDGHPLASGTFGTWNTNYAQSGIFDQVEVLKGAGLNGPTAGESGVGTINLRTRDFSPKNYLELNLGEDSYSGGIYSVFGNVNLLKGDRLSILAGKAFTGYNGPTHNVIADRLGSTTSTAPGTYQIPTITGLDQFVGDLSNNYSLEGELAKLRYRFSTSTSATFEYLGLQGQYQPQGGAYAGFDGNTVLAPCFNAGAPAASAGACNQYSTYNPPYVQYVGNTVPGYFWFPGSVIQNNEPQFSAEFRTTFKNDTVLIRPYAALINRYIDGSQENRYPGNGGGWYQVTNVANCQAQFFGPSAGSATTAKGPCFSAQTTSFSPPAYIGADTTPVVFATTSVAPTCTPTTPCYTTVTAQANDGTYGYGTPFSQPEVDRLHGVTFQYLHPAGPNLYGLSYDYSSEDTSSETNDTSVPPAGCSPVVGTGVSNATPAPGGTPNPFQQPTCSLVTLPRTPIAIPPTLIRHNDFALTGQFALSPQLQLSVGNYLTAYHAEAQIEDQAVLAQATLKGNASGAPVALIPFVKVYTHYDPHIGLAYRPSSNASIRFTAGSSVTTPYANLISGLGRVDLPNGSNNQTYTVTLPNAQLKPETVVAYDLGSDLRLHDGSIFSADLYDDTVHDAFVTNVSPLTIQGVPPPPGGFQQALTINGPLLRAYGVELSFNKYAPLGWGYEFTTSLERSYLDQLPLNTYTATSNLVNGKQLDGSTNGESSIPYAKAYGELRYSGLHDFLFTLGADYEGANNSTYGPPYTLVNTTLRFDLAPSTPLQISVDNWFNYNTGSELGRSLFNQGNLSSRIGLGPGGSLIQLSPTSRSLQQVDFRTYRFTVSRRI